MFLRKSKSNFNEDYLEQQTDTEEEDEETNQAALPGGHPIVIHDKRRDLPTERTLRMTIAYKSILCKYLFK